MGDHRLILVMLMILGVAAKNQLIVASAGVLVILSYTNLQAVFPALEQRGTDLGLIFLLIAVLTPFASGRIGWSHILNTFTSVTGLAAVAGGIMAAVLSGRGIVLLQVRPEVIVGLVLGSIIGVILFKGIPVGPLAAAGFAAVLLRLLE